MHWESYRGWLKQFEASSTLKIDEAWIRFEWTLSWLA